MVWNASSMNGFTTSSTLLHAAVIMLFGARIIVIRSISTTLGNLAFTVLTKASRVVTHSAAVVYVQLTATNSTRSGAVEFFVQADSFGMLQVAPFGSAQVSTNEMLAVAGAMASHFASAT